MNSLHCSRQGTRKSFARRCHGCLLKCGASPKAFLPRPLTSRPIRNSPLRHRRTMVPHNPQLPSIDPRSLIDSDGEQTLADLIAQTGYVIQYRMLIDLKHVLRSGKPWLIEGPRGGGKTALAEALAQSCNLPCFYLQGMQGLTLDDVLYAWDREGQNQWVRQATLSGKSLA